MDHVELRLTGDPNHPIWSVTALGPGKKLPFSTTIGVAPPGYKADVTLAQQLHPGIDYELTVGGGEAFYEKGAFRLEDLQAGEVSDFSGDVRSTEQFVADTRCN